MSSPLVSIIVPTFNYSHLIDQTLSCLVNQDYQQWEAIIVDDGSTDKTEDIVKKFIDLDHRFTYIKQQNSGVSAARNRGLEVAKGKYIQFLDADDLVSISKIDRQVSFLEKNPQVDVSTVVAKYFEDDCPQTMYSSLDKNPAYSTPKLTGQGFEIILRYLKSNLSVIHSPLFKQNILQKTGFFLEGVPYLEDWDFWFRCAITNCTFNFLEEVDVLALVRIHNSSASKIRAKMLEAEGQLRKRFKRYIEESDLSEGQKKMFTKVNKKQTINAYKLLMANTSLLNFKKMRLFREQIQDDFTFLSALLKSLNIKRKFKPNHLPLI